MNGKVSPKINNKVKGVGQECPTHMGNTNTKSNGNTKVRSVGQQCPTPPLVASTSTARSAPRSTPRSKASDRSVRPTWATPTSRATATPRLERRTGVSDPHGLFTSLLFARSKAICSLLVFLPILFGLDSAECIPVFGRSFPVSAGRGRRILPARPGRGRSGAC